MPASPDCQMLTLTSPKGITGCGINYSFIFDSSVVKKAILEYAIQINSIIRRF